MTNKIQMPEIYGGECFNTLHRMVHEHNSELYFNTDKDVDSTSFISDEAYDYMMFHLALAYMEWFRNRYPLHYKEAPSQ